MTDLRFRPLLRLPGRLLATAALVSLVALAGCGGGGSGISDDGAIDTAADTLAGADAEADVPADADADVEADAPPWVDPSLAGPFEWTTESATVPRESRSTPVVAYIPTRGDGATAPLVAFFPGFQTQSAWYAPLCERLASHGYVVVRADPAASMMAPDHLAMALDGIAVIDWALDAGGPVGPRVDPARVATSGHSLGGKVAAMVAYRDSRVSALLLLDPVNGGSPLTGYSDTLPDIVPAEIGPLAIPMGFMGETTDSTAGWSGQACAPADQNFLTFYDAATSAPWAASWDFVGAGHMQFIFDVSTCGVTCSMCRTPTAPAEAVHLAELTLAAAFFRRHFDADGAAEAWLSGDLVPPDVVAQRRP